jgi:hypothetical protein
MTDNKILKQLYEELKKQIEEGEHEEILEITNKSKNK